MKQAVPSSPIILPSLTLYHSFHSWRVWTVFFCISCSRFTDWLIEQFTFKTERVDFSSRRMMTRPKLPTFPRAKVRGKRTCVERLLPRSPSLVGRRLANCLTVAIFGFTVGLFGKQPFPLTRIVSSNLTRGAFAFDH
jgi:hypothetical protein